MKFVEARALADPEAAARKILELANAVEPYFDNRILIKKINGPFLYELRGTPAEYKAGLDRAIEKGWLVLARERHRSYASPRLVRTCSHNLRAATTLRVFRNAHNLLMLLPSNNSIFVPAPEPAISIYVRSGLAIDFTSPGWGTFEKH